MLDPTDAPADAGVGIDAALRRWQAKSTRAVWLPSGTWLQIKLPSALQMAAAGGLPDELRTVAIRFATVGIDLTALDQEGFDRFESFRRRLVASAILMIDTADAQPDPEHPLRPAGATWERLELAPDQLYELPADDLTALNELVDRRKTVEQITGRTIILRGLADKLALPAAAKEGAGSGLAGFRGDGRGAGPGESGGEVRDQAEPDARPRGPGPRPRPRSGPRLPAADRS